MPRWLAAAHAAIVVLALSASGHAQQAAPTPAAAPVQTVHLDALAFDASGRPVSNLRPADFELREDGTVLALDSVQQVAVARGPAAPAPPAPVASRGDEVEQARRPGARLFAVFVDEYHISPESADRARQALTEFIDRDLGPNDLVVLMKPLDSLLTIRLTHDFGPARRIVAALDARKGDYTPRTSYEEKNWAGTPARIEEARTQVVISAINALAAHLGALGDARKTLLLVTEGVMPPPRRRGQEYLATVASTTRTANRSHVSIYPIDPGPATTTDAPADAAGDPRAVLRQLAEDTAGRVIAGGDLTAALHRVATDASDYYMLTYRAAHPEDGAFHPVQLRVVRAGVQVRTRPGYWAPSFEDRVRAAILARASMPPEPLKLEPARHLSPLIEPWFGMSRGADGRTHVTFVWEPAPRVPGDSRSPLASRLVLTALAPDDSTLFEGEVLPRNTAAGGGADGPPEVASFDMPPGSLRTRMRLENTTGQQLDFDVRSVSVRDFQKGVAISTPEVIPARTAREFRELDASEKAVPAPARAFSRTERLLIRFHAYAPDGAPTVTAELLNVAGQLTRKLDVDTGAGGIRQIDLPLAGLAPGDYEVELRATRGSAQVREVVEVRVTS